MNPLRQALGYETQAAFARAIGMRENALNNSIRGLSRFPLHAATRLKFRHGVTLDFVYVGDIAGMPQRIIDALDASTSGPERLHA